MKKLLVIGHVWPEPKTTAAGNRMLQLLDAFLNANYKITFASTALKTSYSVDLKEKGITEEIILLNHSSFDAFVKKLQPDLVIFDRFMVEEQFGWRVAENCPNTIRVLNTEDLHSLREYREHCFKKGKEFNVDGWLQQDKTKREIASIYRSDLTLMISSIEKELLETHVKIPDGLLLHLPFLLEKITAKTQEHWPTFKERSDFISFGNGKHAPNVDSFKYLKQEIWPLIRKELPKASLHIYGAYLPQQLLEMHNLEQGFLVKGWVDDLEKQVKKAKVLLAPLRFGAGIKGKLITAMQCGTPSVTTAIGAEGMYGDLPWAGGVADSPKEIAQSAITLYNSKVEWELAQKQGAEIINQLYDRKILAEILFSRLDDLHENLVKHRSKNFIGAILQHQTMAATKFMGKWIEEKNKHK